MIGREMKDELNALKGLSRCPLIQEVAFDELDCPVLDERADVIQPPTREVIHDSNVSPPLEEAFDQVRADEGSPTGDECRSAVQLHGSSRSVSGLNATKLPSASRSIFVRTNVSTASSGVRQIGSFSLKLVFSSTGTPVRL